MVSHVLFWFHDESAKESFHYHLNQRLHRFHTSVFGIPMVIASPVMYLKFWSNPRYSWNCFISKSETFKDLLDCTQKNSFPTTTNFPYTRTLLFTYLCHLLSNNLKLTNHNLSIEDDCLSNKLMNTKH